MHHQQVTRLPERLDLAREDLFECIVVRRRRNQRCVGRERDGRDRAPLALVPHHVLRREVLRIGRTATVAAEEQRATSVNGGLYHGCGLFD